MPPETTNRPRVPRRWRRGSPLSALFWLPAVLLYSGFVILPMLLGFTYSLTNWTGWEAGGDASDLGGAVANLVRLDGAGVTESIERYLGAEFIGLENYRGLAGDKRFVDLDGWARFRRSAVGFTLFQTVLIMLTFTFGTMVLAVLLDRLRHIKGLIRGLFFYPYILSMLASGLLFQYLGTYDDGAINRILEAIGLGALRQQWMLGPAWAPYFIYALVAWTGTGFFTTLYLANLQAIPNDLYEAARIDGAGSVAVFRRIQFPMLMPTVLTNSVLALIGGFNLFGQIVVTTEGGPARQTESIGYYIYDLGHLHFSQGRAAAVSFLVFGTLVVLAAIQVTFLRRKETAL